MKAGDASLEGGLEVEAVEARRIFVARRWWEPAWSAATELLFPPRCLACGSEYEPGGGAMFCASCDTQLAICQRPTCERCAMICSTADAGRGGCANCRGSKLLYEATRTVGPYQGALRQAVLRAKHASFEALAGALGQRLATVIEMAPFDEWPDVVVAIPMHWMERIRRGTNPAVTMATVIARQLGLPLANGALRCLRRLRRQATLTPPERRKNVRGAFHVSRPAKVAGKRVLLVDDVMTTGATAHEGSRALLQAGAAAVYVATAARSAPHD